MSRFLRLQAVEAPRTGFGRVFGASILSIDSEAWYRGALAELAVAERLAGLGQEWSVLHAVPGAAGDAEIDHVVVGPGGLFALRSRIHAGESVLVAAEDFEVSGRVHDHIRQCGLGVGRVERALESAHGSSVTATGVVVVVGARSITVRAQPRDVSVVNADGLLAWLEARPRILDQKQIETLTGLAFDPATWRQDQEPSEDGRALATRFAIVHRQVGAARAVRRIWIVALASMLIGITALAAVGVALAAASGISL